MKYTWTIVFLWIMLTGHLCAQDRVTISGKVSDAQTGEILPFANLIRQRTMRGTVGKADGTFSLKVNKGDSLTLVCYFSGYESQQKYLLADQDLTLSFALQMDSRMLGFVEVNGLREYPMTRSEITREQLDERNLGLDMPMLLKTTPSAVATSDAGAGIGYTGLRIRGSDATRTNVTINGIALNDAESHGVFWVNMPDFASSVSQITVQRGVGTSVNGAGAFGASVNITTQQPEKEAWIQTEHGLGSFNTRRHNLQFNSGTLGEHFAIYGRYSRLESDGFIDNAFADLQSWFMSASYTGKAGRLTANIFSGQEQTFQAWNGVPESELEVGNRTFNELAVYENETDNYGQDHYQLIYDHAFAERWAVNAALHYTRGKGYFEQYQYDPARFHQTDFAFYGLDHVIIDDSVITNSEFIRRLWLDNHFYGTVFSINYRSDKEEKGRSALSATLGGAWNQYQGQHFGEVIWAEMMSDGFIRHRYYDNDATKTDFNIYAKTQAQLGGQLYGYLDLQYRRVDYAFLGAAINPVGERVDLPQSISLQFFNPKVGLSYYLPQSEIYGSLAVGNKEPNRNDFVNNPSGSRPEHETLYNLEVGYMGYQKNFSYGINLYHMDYHNQLVVTGKVNQVGELTRQNVARSFRQGVEAQARAELGSVSLDANATYSRNRIRNFVEFLDDFDNGGQREIQHGDTDIAFSPNLIANMGITYRPLHSLEAGLIFQAVGPQYLDNTSSASRQLDGFSTVDFRLNWQWRPKGFRLIEFTLLINNLLDEMYEPNGYTFGYIFGGQTIYENRYYPQAGINFLAGVKVRI